MKPQSPNNRLRHFFAGVSEHVFQTRLGVVDPQLIDYITDMLVRFIRSDQLHRILLRRGSELHDASRLLLEAEQHQPQDRREVHRQIGDMALFWTGIFPESLQENSKQDQESNRFGDYCWQGKRAYLIASKLESSDTEDAPGEVLERLADQFEICALGLKTIRQQWKESAGKPGGSSGILFT
jgi:hypothetical protein